MYGNFTSHWIGLILVRQPEGGGEQKLDVEYVQTFIAVSWYVWVARSSCKVVSLNNLHNKGTHIKLFLPHFDLILAHVSVGKQTICGYGEEEKANKTHYCSLTSAFP